VKPFHFIYEYKQFLQFVSMLFVTNHMIISWRTDRKFLWNPNLNEISHMHDTSHCQLSLIETGWL